MKVYRFITGPDESAFCHRVTAALNKGWSLHGSPSLTFDPVQGRAICGQAASVQESSKANRHYAAPARA